MLKTYLFLAFKNIQRHKKAFILNLILIILMLIALMTTISFSSFNKNYINTNYNNNFYFRKMFVNYDNKKYTEQEAIEKLEKVKNIDFVCTQQNSEIGVNADINGKNDYKQTLNLVSCNKKTVPKTKAELEPNTIIIPKRFQAEEDGKILDGDKLIGKNINIQNNAVYGIGESETHSSTYKVIGTYDEKEYFQTNNTCFINYEDMIALNGNKAYTNSDNDSFPIIAICSSYEKINDTQKELSSIDMYGNIASYFNTDKINTIIMFGYFIAGVLLIISFVAIFVSVRMDLNKNKSYYGLLKCMGYKDIQIFAEIVISQMITTISSFIISCIGLAFIMNRLDAYIRSEEETMGYLSVHINVFAVLVGALAIFIIPLLSMILCNVKLSRISPADACKEKSR